MVNLMVSANRYVAKYVSTYGLTSLFVTSRYVKKERKQHLEAHHHSGMVDWNILNHVTLGKEAS